MITGMPAKSDSAEGFQRGPAVHTWQFEVQEDQVWPPGASLGQAVLTTGGSDSAIASLAQVHGDESADVGVILDDQDYQDCRHSALPREALANPGSDDFSRPNRQQERLKSPLHPD